MFRSGVYRLLGPVGGCGQGAGVWPRGGGVVKDNGCGSPFFSPGRVGGRPFPAPRGPSASTWVKGEGLLLQATGLQERPAEAADGVQGVAHPSFGVGDAGVTFLQQL